MTADQFLLALFKYWRGVLAIAVIGILVALGFAATRPVLYRSSSTVYVSAAASGSRGGLIQSSHYVDTAVQSLAKVGTTPSVLDPVISTLGLRVTAQQLAERVSVDVGTNTVVLTVRALDATPAGSVRLANAVRQSLGRQQAVLASRVPGGDGTVPGLSVHTVSAPRLPTTPTSPNLPLIVGTGVLVGLLLGLLYAVARQLVRTRVTSVAEVRGVRRAESVAILGAVTTHRADEHDGSAEAPTDEYRTIALHLGLPGAGPRALVVTGSGVLDDAAAVARGIANAAAERSGRVLLVDADLRRAVTERPVIGLAELLQGSSALQDVLQPGSAFTVLSAGSPSVDPGALLGSDAMRHLAGQLGERFDLVVLEVPPVLAGPDALGLAALADGAVLVARGGVTRAAHLTRSIESVRMAGVALQGIVFERPRRRRAMPWATRSGARAATAAPDADAPAAPAAPAATQPVSTRVTAGVPDRSRP